VQRRRFELRPESSGEPRKSFLKGCDMINGTSLVKITPAVVW
jgi:hypothetical protein